MTISVATSLRNNYLQSLANAVDAAATPGILTVFSGTRPASGAAITSQTALVTQELTQPAFGAPGNGVMTAEDFTPTAIEAAGQSVWFRITDGDGNFVLDGDVGTGATDLTVSTTTFTVGVIFDATGITITAGGA